MVKAEDAKRARDWRAKTGSPKVKPRRRMRYCSNIASVGLLLAIIAGDARASGSFAGIGWGEWRLRFDREVATVAELDVEIRLAAAPAIARTNRTADTNQTPPTTHNAIFMVRPFC
jgi:hypothetical protein